MDSNLRAENRMLKEQLEIIANENKQLKEENEKLLWYRIFNNNKECSILVELEEWLENNWKSTQDIWYVKIINKIQELKEKYK